MPNIPLAVYIPPENLPEFFAPLVNNVVFTNEVLDTNTTGWSISMQLALASGTPISELIFPSAHFPLAVSFKNLTRLSIVKILDDYSLRYNPTEIDILLPTIFKNAQIDQSTGRLIAAGNGRAKINLALQEKYIEFNTINGVNFLMPNLSSFTPVINASLLIGDTGIGLSLQELIFEANEAGIEAEVRKAKVYFPQNLGAPDIEINSGRISKNGFTGELKFDWNLQLENNTYKMNGHAVKLFEVFTGGLDFFAVRFENNTIISCQITGEMLIPFFNDKPLRINVLINDEGKLVVGVQSAGEQDLKFTKDELLQLQLQTLELDSQASSVSISGGLEPLLFAKDGVKWPRMDVRNLRIDSSGRISIEEAWLDLKDLVNLDLFGFHFELRRIGIGTTIDEKMWVDISGAVKLIEQLPLGLDVEGFRLTWPRSLAFTPDMSLINLQQELAKIEVQFQGVEINFAIPAVVKIDGLIRFFKEAQKVGFAGDMKLAVIAAGFTAEAGLMVGINFEEPPFPFMYVYFGFESTAGIPLAQTGLALKGAIGLIGMNVAPKKNARTTLVL